MWSSYNKLAAALRRFLRESVLSPTLSKWGLPDTLSMGLGLYLNEIYCRIPIVFLCLSCKQLSAVSERFLRESAVPDPEYARTAGHIVGGFRPGLESGELWSTEHCLFMSQAP